MLMYSLGKNDPSPVAGQDNFTSQDSHAYREQLLSLAVGGLQVLGKMFTLA